MDSHGNSHLFHEISAAFHGFTWYSTENDGVSRDFYGKLPGNPMGMS